jgi:hypothetical protein
MTTIATDGSALESASDATYCYVHPDRETGLSCTQCGEYICTQCTVQAPVGQLCKACARGRRPANYQVPIGALALGAGAAFGVSLAMHAAMLWVSAVSYSFFLPICLTFLIASTVGHTFVRGLDRLTRGKRGQTFQIAIGSAIGLGAVLVTGYALLDPYYFTEEAALVGFFGVVVAMATMKQLR